MKPLSDRPAIERWSPHLVALVAITWLAVGVVRLDEQPTAALQMPVVISGGIAPLALLGFGCAMWTLQAARGATAARRAAMVEFIRAVQQLRPPSGD